MSTSLEGSSKGNFVFPETSPETDKFLQTPEMAKFIEWHFAPGGLKVQEAQGTPVPPQIQEKILRTLPQFLTEMCFSGIPINEPDQEQIPTDSQVSTLSQSQLEALRQQNKPKHENPTNLLKPDRIDTDEAQSTINYTMVERNRRLQSEFGARIWTKLVKKALTEPRDGKSPNAIHPIKALQNYNGMVIGLPTNHTHKKYSELNTEADKAGTAYSTDDIITLMLYEAENDLLTKEDDKEIDKLIQTSPVFSKRFVQRLRDSKQDPNFFTILGRLPITWSLINNLILSEENLIFILSYKVKHDLLDDTTLKTVEEIANNDANTMIIAFLDQEGTSHPSLIRISPLRKRLQKAASLQKASTINPQDYAKAEAQKAVLARTDEYMEGIKAHYDSKERAQSKKTDPEDNNGPPFLN